MIARRTLIQLSVGLALGLAAAVGVGRLLQSTLVWTSATDPITLLAISAITILVAIAASLKPAQRATQLDPVVALRYE
jgi:ABC-type antimicrobial peptide transport system permease subunit